MGYQVQRLAVAGAESHFLQPALQPPRRVTDWILEVFVIEGQDEVIAVRDAGPLQAAGHVFRLANDAVDEQSNPLGLADSVPHPGGISLVLDAEVVTDLRSGQNGV